MAELSAAAIKALEGVAQDRSLNNILQGLGGEISRGLSSSNVSVTDNAGTDKFFADLASTGTTLLDGAVKFGGNLATGTAKISNLTGTAAEALGKLPGIGGALGALAGYGQEMVKFAESSVDTLEGLSGSGASFNNSIVQMNYAASQSRLTLDEFAGLVSKNSQTMAGFGGSVTEGAKRFSRMSGEFFDQGLGDDLINMGLTFEEVNESLASYMEFNRRNIATGAMGQQQALESAAAMAKEMDMVAKLTGQNRKEMEAEVNSRMREGQVQAKLKLLEMQGNTQAADEYKRALVQAQKAGPDAVAALQETFTKGTVVSDAGRRGMVALGEAGAELTNIVSAINDPARDVGPSLDQFNAAVVERVNSTEFLNIATLGGMGGVADAAAGILENAGPYADAVRASTEGAIDESSSRAAILEAVRDMEENARNEQEARDGITHTMQMADARMKDIYAGFGQELYAPGTGIVAGISSSDALAGRNGSGRTLDDLTRDDIQEIVSALRGVVPGAGGGEAFATGLDMPRPEDTTVTQEQHDTITEVVRTIRARINDGLVKNTDDMTQTLERLLTGPNAALAVQLLEDISGDTTASQEAIAAITSENTELINSIQREIQDFTQASGVEEQGINETTRTRGNDMVNSIANRQDPADANRQAQFNADNMTVTNATLPTSQSTAELINQIEQRNQASQTEFQTSMGDVNTALGEIPTKLDANATATTTGLEGIASSLSTTMEGVAGKLEELLEATREQTGRIGRDNRRVQ